MIFIPRYTSQGGFMYKHKHPNVSGSVKQIWFLHQCPVSAMLLSIEFHKMGANTLD